MKKFLLPILVFVMTASASAQISLTGADMPEANRINYVYVDTTSTPSIGTASPVAQNWNFSTLYQHYPQVASFSPITPYQAYGSAFPGSNMFTYGPAILYAGLYGGAPVDLGDQGYMFWRSDIDGFYVVGFRTDYGLGDRNILESPQEVLMGTPASYDSSFGSISRWVANFDNLPLDQDTFYISTVYKTLDCDAFGTVTTPFGVFNSLRVHEYMITIDSVIGKLGSITYLSLELFRDTVNNYYWWANGVGYPVAIAKADADDSIHRMEYLFDTVTGHTVTGQVFRIDETTPVNTGEAELFVKTLFDGLYGVPEVVPLVSGGHFQFSNIVDGGNFLVQARPDINDYPFDVPTYYGDSIYWQDALTLTVISDTAIVINCRNDSLGYAQTGLGVITGTIWENLSGAKDMNLAGGVKVTLEQNPSGITARHTYTDAQGKYRFEDVPQQDYIIRVDIPACPMDSTYWVYYSAGDTTTANLDFYYDSSFIYVFNTAGIADDATLPEIGVNVYPNPFEETTYLYFTDVEPGRDCEVRIYDITGRAVAQIPGHTPFPVRIDRPSNCNGMLFYDVLIDGLRRTSGKLIVR